jgi:hypothetical protein
MQRQAGSKPFTNATQCAHCAQSVCAPPVAAMSDVRAHVYYGVFHLVQRLPDDDHVRAAVEDALAVQQHRKRLRTSPPTPPEPRAESPAPVRTPSPLRSLPYAHAPSPLSSAVRQRVGVLDTPFFMHGAVLESPFVAAQVLPLHTDTPTASRTPSPVQPPVEVPVPLPTPSPPTPTPPPPVSSPVPSPITLPAAASPAPANTPSSVGAPLIPSTTIRPQARQAGRNTRLWSVCAKKRSAAGNLLPRKPPPEWLDPVLRQLECPPPIATHPAEWQAVGSLLRTRWGTLAIKTVLPLVNDIALRARLVWLRTQVRQGKPPSTAARIARRMAQFPEPAPERNTIWRLPQPQTFIDDDYDDSDTEVDSRSSHFTAV